MDICWKIENIVVKREEYGGFKDSQNYRYITSIALPYGNANVSCPIP